MIRFLTQYNSPAGSQDSTRVVYPTGLFLLFLILLILTIFAFAILKFWYMPRLNAQIEKQDDNIKALAEKISLKDRENFTDFYSRVNNIKILLRSHIYSSNLLNRVETLAHPRVLFSSIKANNRQKTVEIYGFAADQAALAEQILAFERDQLFNSARVNKISMSGNGFNFEAILSYKPELLLFNQ